MKINNFLFILGLSTITAVQTIAQEKKQAVSIVFTDQSDRATVDAVIPVGEEHLDALLKKHQLTQNDVHLIRMDMQLNWAEKPGQDHKEIMVIQTEELVDGKQPTSVQVIRINGEEKSMDDLSEEERAMIENHSKHPQTKSMRIEEHHVEKVVEMKKDGNGEDGDVRIEVKVENGKEQVNVWLNGEQLSEDEAVAYAQEHDRLGGAHEEERDFVFVSEDEQVHKGKMIVKSEVRMENSGTPKKAVVVVKEVNFNKASGTSKIDGMAGGLRLFPNPASGEVKVQFDHEVNGLYEVNISTLDGKVLIAEEGQGKGAVTQRIDLSELAAGTYILTLSYSGGMNAQKLIVE